MLSRPTCSRVEIAIASSKAPSANGNSRRSAWTLVSPGTSRARKVDARQLRGAEADEPGEVGGLGKRVADVEHSALARVAGEAPRDLDRTLVGSRRRFDVAGPFSGRPLCGRPGDRVVQSAEVLVLGRRGELAEERRPRHPRTKAFFRRDTLGGLDRTPQDAAPQRVEVFTAGVEPGG